MTMLHLVKEKITKYSVCSVLIDILEEKNSKTFNTYAFILLKILSDEILIQV